MFPPRLLEAVEQRLVVRFQEQHAQIGAVFADGRDHLFQRERVKKSLAAHIGRKNDPFRAVLFAPNLAAMVGGRLST